MEQLFASLTSSSENYRITGTAFFSEARENSHVTAQQALWVPLGAFLLGSAVQWELEPQKRALQESFGSTEISAAARNTVPEKGTREEKELTQTSSFAPV